MGMRWAAVVALVLLVILSGAAWAQPGEAVPAGGGAGKLFNYTESSNTVYLEESQLGGGDEWVAKIPKVPVVDLDFGALAPEKLSVLTKLKSAAHVTDVRIKVKRMYTDADLKMIEALPELRTLTLASYIKFRSGDAQDQMTDEAMGRFIRSVKTQCLYLYMTLSTAKLPGLMPALGTRVDFAGLSLRVRDARDADLVHLAGLKNLTNLVIHTADFPPVTDAGLAWIGKLAKLEVLHLVNMKGVKGRFLKDCRSLRTLNALVVGMDDESIRGGWVGRLTFLVLSETQVTSEGLAGELGESNAVSISFGSTPVTPALYERLAQCKRLRFVKLRGLDDKGLEVLGRCQTLKNLRVFDTKLTPGAIAAFKTAHPNIVVESTTRMDG